MTNVHVVSPCLISVFVGNKGGTYREMFCISMQRVVFLFFNLLLKISNLPSNLCQPGVSWLAPSSHLSSLLHLLHPHSLSHHSGTLSIRPPLELCSPTSLPSHCRYSSLPSFPLLSSIHLLLSSPLPDVRRAGLAVCWPQPPASWRRGINQMFGCIFILGFINLRRACSNWQGGRFRWRTEGTFLHTLAGTFGVILSLFSFSHSSSSSSSLSRFWIMFSWVWLEGDAPGRCKSGKGCWHRGGNSGGRQMKSLPPSLSGLLLLKVDGDLRVRTPSVSVVRPLASPPASHVKSAQEQKCLLGEYCLCGCVRVDYKSSVCVLFHLCQLYLLWNLLSLAVPF